MEVKQLLICYNVCAITYVLFTRRDVRV